MAPAQLAVLGGGYAGVLAARRLAATLGDAARVTLWTSGDRFVERIRLHQLAAGQAIARRALAPLLGRASLARAQVRAIDPVARTVETSVGTIAPDFAVLALGSATARAIPGSEHALTLDDPGAATAVAAAAAGPRPGPLAIVGGGLTAIELAAELAAAWPARRLVLVTRGRLGDGALGPAAAAIARAALVAGGVELIEGATVETIAPDAIAIDGARRAVAATVVCAGFVASPLAAAAGRPVDRLGRMLVDDTLAADAAGWLWGAGDAAMPRDPVGARLDPGCKTALPMAARVADNLAAVVRGRAPERFCFGDVGACVSLGRRAAVIERRAADGAPRGVIAGRPAAWIKEWVVRSTVATVRWRWAQRSLALYHRRGVAVLAAPSALALPTSPP
jgi:NADH dehydrogenase